MKILMACIRITPNFSGGIDGCLRSWTRLLAEDRHSVSIVSNFARIEDVTSQDIPAERHHVPTGVRLPGRIAYFGDFLYAERLAKAVERKRLLEDVDVVMVHEANIAPRLFGLCRKRGIRTVYVVHQTLLGSEWRFKGLKRHLLKHYNLEAARRADRCISVSDSIHAIHAGYGLPQDRLSVVCNPVERLAEPSGPTSCSDLRVLWVGSLIERKRPEVAVDAACQILDRGSAVQFDFVGDGPMRSMLERRAGRHLGHGILFHGEIHDQAEMSRMRLQSSILLFTTEHETFGRVLAEGMDAGLACVASDLPVLREVGGTSAVYVPVGDSASVADAIDRLAADPEERMLLGLAGKDRVAQLYSLSAARSQLSQALGPFLS
jgi:glycosyltransferase involved in cell wall biosynthesis